MKRRDQLTELRGKDMQALTGDVKLHQEKLLNLRFQHAFRKLKNVHEIQAQRQTIARLQTIIREKISGQLSETKES